MKNQEVLGRMKAERNIIHTIKRRRANWIAHILRRKYLLKHMTEERLKGREDEEENLSSYWMTLRKR
jgi:hypothetical protein